MQSTNSKRHRGSEASVFELVYDPLDGEEKVWKCVCQLCHLLVVEVRQRYLIFAKNEFLSKIFAKIEWKNTGTALGGSPRRVQLYGCK